MALPDLQSDFLIKHSQRIIGSYRRWFGKELVTAGTHEEQALALFDLPAVIASTDTQEDPVLNYGNRAALNLWELPWGKFTQTPGRHTAEPMERATRTRFLDEVRCHGFVEHYQGIRISSTGRRFQIHRAKVWNLLDEKNIFYGQAVTFAEWKYL